MRIARVHDRQTHGCLILAPALLVTWIGCSDDCGCTDDNGTDVVSDTAVDRTDDTVLSDRPEDPIGEGVDPSGDAADPSGETGDLPSEASDLTGEADRSADGLTVVTLNLRCLIDNWDARLPIIADVLADLQPDMMGFQEVCAETNGRDNLAELMAALGERTDLEYRIERTITHRAWDQYDEGIAVVSPHAMSGVAVTNLPTGTFPRKMVSARISTPRGTVLFGTTHLDHLSETVRANQIDRVIAKLSELRQTDEAVVLTGDLNEGPGGGVEGAMLDAGYTDIWSLLHPSEDGFTIPSSQPASRIDWIWFDANGSGLVPDSIERILDAPVNGVYGSDHLGVSAILVR